MVWRSRAILLPCQPIGSLQLRRIEKLGESSHGGHGMLWVLTSPLLPGLKISGRLDIQLQRSRDFALKGWPYAT
jgi:hypothetical protein